MDQTGSRLKLIEARDELELSQAQAGELICLSQQAVSALETGASARSRAGRRTLRRLCRALMKRAEELGYDPADFREWVLCPGDFKPPREGNVA